MKKFLAALGLILMGLAFGMNLSGYKPIGPILLFVGGFILFITEYVLILKKKDETP